MRNSIAIIRLLLVSVLFAGCELRDLESYYESVAGMHIAIDWSHFSERPSGMTLLFSKDGDEVTRTVVTNNVDNVDVYLTPGTYYMTMMNQSFDEFGSMHFEQTKSHNLVTVRANPLLQTRGEQDEANYMQAPEPIAVTSDTIVITDDMVSRRYVFADYRNRDVKVDTTHYDTKETPMPMTTTLNIQVRVKGINNLRAVEGYINGMADGFLLSQVWRTETTGTLLLDQWKAKFDHEDNGLGWITTSIPTFGLPHGKEIEWQRTETDNVILLRFTLIDGTTREFTYNVGKFIKYRGDIGDIIARTDLTLELLLVIDADTGRTGEGGEDFPFPELPDVENDGNGGAFEAFVDEWEDGGDISVPL